MALLLAPYTSAMQLGQGFNSYTQEIILNDVVTIDPSREESFVTNDGCTMKQQRASMYKHEARPNSGPVVVPAAMQKSKMSSESSKKMTSSATKPVERAIDVYYDGLVEHSRDQSQTVDYNARLVEKISEVTENMNISGGFAIKYGKVGGSLQGGYINTEKFAESDINFYISVKVVNQSINIQDATVFQPIDESVKEMTSEQFTKIYGDCFISGFEEGGEFHAIVSIKARDKSHTKEITAKAQLAFNVGPVEVSASTGDSGLVGHTESELRKESEITLQIFWTGGGQIKPETQGWTIDSLRAAAAAFPARVAKSPKRTHAILSKYDTLRSFHPYKTANFSNTNYQLANDDTQQLLEYDVAYKRIRSSLQKDLQQLECGLGKFDNCPQEFEEGDRVATIDTLDKIDPRDYTRFDFSVEGIDLAIEACSLIKKRILEEVENLTRDPKKLAGKSVGSIIQRPERFLKRLPKVIGINDDVTPISRKFLKANSDTSSKNAQDWSKTFITGISDCSKILKCTAGSTSDSILLVEIPKERCYSNLHFGLAVVETKSFDDATLEFYPDTERTDGDKVAMYLSCGEDLSSSKPKSLEKLTCLKYSWLSVPISTTLIQRGIETIYPQKTGITKVMFDPPGEGNPPEVCVWISGMKIEPLSTPYRERKCSVSAMDICRSGFTIITRWGLCSTVQASWCAFDRVSSGLQTGLVCNRTTCKGTFGSIKFPKPNHFEKPPAVLIGLKSFRMKSPSAELSSGCEVEKVTAEGFLWKLYSDWDDTGKEVEAQYSYLAVPTHNGSGKQ